MEHEIECAKCRKTFVAGAGDAASITTCPTCSQIGDAGRLPSAKSQRTTAMQVVLGLLFMGALTFCCAVIGLLGAVFLDYLLVPPRRNSDGTGGLGTVFLAIYGAVGCATVGLVASVIFIARTGMKATTRQYAKATGITFCLVIGGLLLLSVPAFIAKLHRQRSEEAFAKARQAIQATGGDAFYSNQHGEVKTYVNFSKATDSELKQLVAFEGLTELKLNGSSITDIGLAELSGFTELQTLDLRGTKVTDAGLKHLGGLTKLYRLNLSDTGVTGAGMKELANTRVSHLNLRNTKVTDQGIKGLTSLGLLESLCLRNTKLSDLGLKELSGLEHLEILDLSGTSLTDAGLKELGGCRSLRYLGIEGTMVTDRGKADFLKGRNHGRTSIPDGIFK